MPVPDTGLYGAFFINDHRNSILRSGGSLVFFWTRYDFVKQPALSAPFCSLYRSQIEVKVHLQIYISLTRGVCPAIPKLSDSVHSFLNANIVFASF